MPRKSNAQLAGSPKREAIGQCHLALTLVLRDAGQLEAAGDVAAIWIARAVEGAVRGPLPLGAWLDQHFPLWWEERLGNRPSLLSTHEQEAVFPGLSQAHRMAQELLAGHLGGVPWEPDDEAILGEAFEGQLLGTARRKHGQFYTPAPIVDYLLDHALAGFDPVRTPDLRLLDPACGAGNFLVAAGRHLFEAFLAARPRLYQAYPETSWEPEALLPRVFERHLFGCDLNPWALEVAAIRLRLAQLALGHEHGLGLMFPRETTLHRDDTLHPLDEPFFAKPFDVVVGNPPYGAELAVAQRSAYQQRYRLGRGRFDSTALFVERTIDLLAPGGALGFVVPHGITRTGAYAPLRSLMAEQTLVRFLDMGCMFKGVNLETIAFVLRKGAPMPGDSVHLDTMRDGPLARIGDQAPAFFRGRPTFPLYVDRRATGLVEKLERAGTPLEDLARIRRGVGISARSPHLVAGSGVPVVRGRDIARYGPLRPSALLGWHRVPPGGMPLLPALDLDLVNPEPFVEPRIGFQNIASSVVATLLPVGCAPLDTVNWLDPLSAWHPAYVLAVLNSDLIDWYLGRVLTNRAQLTIHLDAPTAGTLPILLPDASEQEAIAAEALRLLALQAEIEALDPREAAREAQDDREVEQAYGAFVACRKQRYQDARALHAAIEGRLHLLYGLSEAESAIVTAGAKPSRKPPGASGRELDALLAERAGLV